MLVQFALQHSANIVYKSCSPSRWPVENSMFESSFLSIFGLAIEIVGLVFLFKDLLTSKNSEISIIEFREIQDSINLSSQSLVIQLNRGLVKLVDFIKGYLSLLEMEAQYVAHPENITEQAKSDPNMAEILDMLEKTSPVKLRNYAVSKFVEASSALPDERTLQRALALVQGGQNKLRERYIEEVKRSAGLRTIARLGVLFVAVGAFFQFVDLLA